jgi:hypothetical protein
MKFRKIQNSYKIKFYNKNYYRILLKSICIKKYILFLNIYEIDLKYLKEIKEYANILGFIEYKFKSEIILNVFLNSIFSGYNGHILMYATNNKDLFFLLIKKINPYYLISYNYSLIYYKKDKDFMNLFNLYNNNYNEVFLIIYNIIYINFFLLIYFFILYIIFKI